MTDFAPGPSLTVPPAPPKPGRPVWPFVAVIALLVAALVTVIAWPRGNNKPAPTAAVVSPAAAATFSVTGTLTLKAGQFIKDDSQLCWGDGGYDDLAMGASVTITDASGTVIGVGQVDSAHNDGGMTGTCGLSFKVDGVPTGKGFYGVEVSHRGAIKESEQDLKTGSADLAIG